MGPFFAARPPRSGCRPGWRSGCGWALLLSASRSSASCGSPARWASAAPWPGSLAGLAFALSPRLLTVLGADLGRGRCRCASRPGCSCRWCRPRADGDRATRGLRSAVAVLCMGGVNAAATAGGPAAARGALAAHPLPRAAPDARLMPLVDGRRGRARDRVVGGAAAAARPVQPAVPRLHRERDASRPGPTSLVETLRGTSHWLAYLAGRDGPALARRLDAGDQPGRDRRHGRRRGARARRAGVARHCRSAGAWRWPPAARRRPGDRRARRLVRRPVRRGPCGDLLDAAAGAAAQRAQVRRGAAAAARAGRRVPARAPAGRRPVGDRAHVVRRAGRRADRRGALVGVSTARCWPSPCRRRRRTASIPGYWRRRRGLARRTGTRARRCSLPASSVRRLLLGEHRATSRCRRWPAGPGRCATPCP